MHKTRILFPFAIFVSFVIAHGPAVAAAPNPVLNSVFPPGGSVGETFVVTIAGGALDGPTELRCNAAGVTFEQVESDKNQFRVSVAPDTPLGLYDVRAVCGNGLSSPRPFVIGNRPEHLEREANEKLEFAPTVPLDAVVNGRIEKAGDTDYFRIEARQGQRVIIECTAERIDSQLRAVLEIFDEQGKHLRSSRGFFGVDPLIDFHVPADGAYIVKISNLTYTGGTDHYYRLDIDTGPRVAFVSPAVVQFGQSARVTLFGWNLTAHEAVAANPPAASAEIPGAVPAESLPEESSFDRIEVEIPANMIRDTWPLPFRLQPAQAAIRGFPYYFPAASPPFSSA